MYQQYIDELKPLPKWNLQWYTDDDQYSDGIVEDEIVRLIAEHPVEDYVQAIHDHYSWPVYYHLTQVRRNILNWYEFASDSDVLEIGCGFGAITGLLCEKCRSVTAVELSKRRAAGALLRNRDRDNLEIIVGNLNDISFEKKFDYITLIGVLEYQGRFTDTDHPYHDFLKKIKSLLKPNGKLLIAIENQYGLKYWCGAGEDHTGVPFDGMNQYLLTNQGIRTFSREALKKLVQESGFAQSYFYYPMPDYKLPTVIYSEKYLPQNANMQNVEYYYAPKKTTLLADEKQIYGDILENGVFEFMANSFLAECSDSADLGEVSFACLCNNRQRPYQIGTRLRGDGRIEKFPLHEAEGAAHIRQTVANEEALHANGLDTLGSRLENGRLVVDYTDAPSMEDLFVAACRAGDREEAKRLVDALYDEILRSSEEVSWENNLVYMLKPSAEQSAEKYGPILKQGYLDMTFKNAFCMNGKVVWYDQEWMLENIPAKFILYRALGTTYYSFQDQKDKISIREWLEEYGILEVIEEFRMLESLFNGSVRDEMHNEESRGFQGVDMEQCVTNIKKLMGMTN